MAPKMCIRDRGHKADGEVDHHDHAEMDGVHPHLQDERQQDGRQDDDGGERLHKGAYPQQQEVDEQQDRCV